MMPEMAPIPETPRMVVTDFDGTLLGSDGSLAGDDLAALRSLGDHGILRVIATGRSPFSYRRAMGGRSLPVDIIVFSSGAITARMPDLEILESHVLTAAETRFAVEVCLDHDVDFMVQDPPPGNHCFSWRRGPGSPDFERRLSLYEGFTRKLPRDLHRLGPATQLLVVLPSPDAAGIAEEITRSLSGYSVIRATSPLDGDSLWLEIFPGGVSKSAACAHLARERGIDPEEVLAVGNDYNDLDVLRWAGTGFVTGNAPGELRAEFPVVAGNDHGGVAEAVKRWLEG